MPNADCGIRNGEIESEIYNLKFEIIIGGVVQLVRASRGVSREGCESEKYFF
jgi:hypothetical protein